MADDRTPPSVSDENINFFRDWLRQLRLAWRLFWDPRVSAWAKAVPLLAIAYALSPIDLIPNAVVPVVGAMDDLAVVLFGLKVFVEVCPPEVVQEHTQAIFGAVKGWRVVREEPGAEDETPRVAVIDAPYRVEKDAEEGR